MQFMRHSYSFVLLPLLALFTSCRKDVEIFTPEQEVKGVPQITDVLGFYLLNEGNMGSNKATLDYYDFSKAEYTRNIYGAANPSVPKEMGDVGNDIAIYGQRLYAVINCSNKVEVMDARTARRIGQVEIPNCRYLCFHEGYAYVTSYAGPVVIDPDYEQRGYVAKVDTATLQVVATCLVGFQPDGIEVADDQLFVANSGGYMDPNYETELSVIDLKTFTETQRIPVAKNLHHVKADTHGQLWVNNRGDYLDTPSRLYCVDLATKKVTATIENAVSDFDICGDSLYFYSTDFSEATMQYTITYGIVNVVTRQVVTQHFITDGTEQQIRKPYGVKVHPLTRDIFVTDARDYVSPGTLYCFSKEGTLKWSARTGDIPAHIAFLCKMTVQQQSYNP